jgi:hypothetical protein
MPGKTTFLSLVLPGLGEFQNAWNDPLNQNFEALDDWMGDLFESLVGSSATSTWSSLRGSLGSLASRLNVSINADGTVNLSSAPDLLALASSTVYGTQANPRTRFDLSDLEVYSARSPVLGDRFNITPPALGNLDVGIAHRTRDYGLASGNAMGSPPARWAPGMVDGNSAVLAGSGIGKLVFSGVSIGDATTWPVFNVDGYLFRIRESLVIDFTLLAPANGQLVYVYVERRDYGDANFKYRGSTDLDANLAVKDLRTLQSGSDGAIGVDYTIFASAGAHFSTAKLGQVLPGDLLVISGGAAAGTYVIASVTSDTQVVISGKFKSNNLSGMTWTIKDNGAPNVGAVAVSAVTDPPPFQSGRAYIGSCLHNTGGSPTSITTFAKSGVADSGWQAVTAAGSFPFTFAHNLGVQPTEVDIWFRASGTSPEYPPLVLNTSILPSVSHKSSNVSTAVRLINQPGPAALFVDDTNTNIVSGQIRVIARR